MWRNVLFALFIILIVALVLLFSWMSQPIETSMACIDKGTDAISIEYQTNIPCFFHVRWTSDTSVGFDHYGLGLTHKAYFIPGKDDKCYDMEMIFVSLTGEVKIIDCCLERFGRRY